MNKTLCRWCSGWISWSHNEGRFYHLDSGKPVCANGSSVATRNATAPMVALSEEDKARVKP